MAEISLHDRILAHAVTAVSYLSANVRPVGNLVMGNDARVRRVAYRAVQALGKNGSSSWASYRGNPKAPRLPLPRLYAQVAQTWVNPAVADAYESSDTFRPAVAWKLGDVVMAAAIGQEDWQAVLAQGFYGMRLGRGQLHTAIGMLLPSGQDLIISSKGVKAGSITDSSEFPPNGLIF